MSDKTHLTEILDLQSLRPTDQLSKVVLVDKAPHVTILALCTENGVKHVVQKSNLKSESEIVFSNQVMSSPSSFFNYPLSCILGKENPSESEERKVSSLLIKVTNASDRKSILSRVENYVGSLTASPSLRNDIVVVVDETLSNAIYNAPFRANQKNTFERSHLDNEIAFEKQPVIFAGHDSERIIVGCRDSYGTLNVDDLLHRIKMCYDSNVSEMINFGEGGAGIGTFLVFDSCASMYIGVDADHTTTICCSFPYKLSATQRSDLPKNLHVIQR